MFFVQTLGMLGHMFETDPTKKAQAKTARYEAQKARRIQEEENPKDAKKTFNKLLGLVAVLGAASNEDVRATGAAVIDGVTKGIVGRELLVDLPSQPLQVHVPPVSDE